MTDQLVNLTVFIPWIIMAFVLDEKKLTAENLVSLFPGSQIGNRQYVVALWSKSSRKLRFDKKLVLPLPRVRPVPRPCVANVLLMWC
jgi:hypothetical protein